MSDKHRDHYTDPICPRLPHDPYRQGAEPQAVERKLDSNWHVQAVEFRTPSNVDDQNYVTSADQPPVDL